MDDAREAGLYPMRVVSRLTGLTADTIRAWERRYGAIEPDRSLGNTRRFSAKDVRRLTLLRESTQRGHSIGTIATMSTDELESLLDKSPSASAAVDGSLEPLVEMYLAAVARFEGRRALELLTRAASLVAPRQFIFDVVTPILGEVGRRWSHDDLGVAQEHLVSVHMSNVLGTMMLAASSSADRGQILVTTPAGHRHAFGAQVAALLATSRGYEVVFLGPDLPDEDLRWAAEMSRCEIVVLSVVRNASEYELERLARTLDGLSESTEVWVGTPPDHALLKRTEKVRYFHRFEDYDRALVERRSV